MVGSRKEMRGAISIKDLQYVDDMILVSQITLY